MDEDGRQWRDRFSVVELPSRQCAEALVSCCDETTARVPASDVTRRSLFKGAALVASVIPAARPSTAEAQGKPIKLAYCSQLLCGVPYEVARSADSSRPTGSTCSSSTPAAATLPCRRWSAARWITRHRARRCRSGLRQCGS